MKFKSIEHSVWTELRAKIKYISHIAVCLDLLDLTIPSLYFFFSFYFLLFFIVINKNSVVVNARYFTT